MSSKNKIAEGELAVRLKSKISGGVGTHDKGAILRNLSPSAFNTLVNGGGHEALAAGTIVSADKVEAAAPPAPTGDDTKK